MGSQIVGHDWATFAFLCIVSWSLNHWTTFVFEMTDPFLTLPSLLLNPSIDFQFSYCMFQLCGFYFIAWWEAFPCWSEKASEVEKSLLKERIPRFVFSVSIQSDSGGAFIATQVSGAWKLRWGCHETCNFFFDMCTLLYLFFTCFIFGHAGSSSLQAGFL